MARKFKVGDVVKIVTSKYDKDDTELHSPTAHHIGKVAKITAIDGHYGHPISLEGVDDAWAGWELELAKDAEVLPTGRATYRLKKNLPELKKGAVVQEKCDDGDQDFEVLDAFRGHVKYENEDGGKYVTYPRGAVEKEPSFWERVYSATPSWLNEAELETQKKFYESLKKKKAKK